MLVVRSWRPQDARSGCGWTGLSVSRPRSAWLLRPPAAILDLLRRLRRRVSGPEQAGVGAVALAPLAGLASGMRSLTMVRRFDGHVGALAVVPDAPFTLGWDAVRCVGTLRRRLGRRHVAAKVAKPAKASRAWRRCATSRARRWPRRASGRPGCRRRSRAGRRPWRPRPRTPAARGPGAPR